MNKLDDVAKRCWDALIPVTNQDHNVMRQDRAGHLCRRDQYNDPDADYGWYLHRLNFDAGFEAYSYKAFRR